MLCFEGIQLMLNIFRGKKLSPNYQAVPPANGKLEVLTAHQEVSKDQIQTYDEEALMR